MTKYLLGEKVLMINKMKFTVLTDYCDVSIVCDDIPIRAHKVKVGTIQSFSNK